jgi:hypothetical protein
MAKIWAQLLLISLLFAGCICQVAAQSGRVPREKPKNPGAPGTKSSAATNEDASAIQNAGPSQITLLVMLSRNRRLVMLPPSNQMYADRIAKSLGRNDRLSVRFDPQKIKVEDAQKMLRAGMRTYILLLRFEEFNDRNEHKKSGRWGREGATSYKMDYTLLVPESGAVAKQRSIQTFFSSDADARPLFELFVKNCLNTSRHSLDDSAVQCMTRHVLADLYNFARPSLR